MDGDNGSGAVPDFVAAWLKANPEVVTSWLTDPSFRTELLANPSQFITDSQVHDWVEERIRARGTERILGEHPGSIVAM